MAGTGIGNPKDIPQRSLEYANSADMMIFEEDRPARQILKAAGVHRDYFKFSEHKDNDTLDELRQCLKNKGTACYMSDQGMPILADPGKELLKVAYQQNSQISVIPGPSSVTAAIAACPFIDNSFYFKGFLPRNSEARLKALKALSKNIDPFIILDTPYRLKPLVSDVANLIPKRKCLLAIDISGDQEEFIYSNTTKLASDIAKVPKKLNFVLIVKGV